MINFIPAFSRNSSYQNTRNNVVSHPSFQGAGLNREISKGAHVITQHVQPINQKHLPLLDKLQDFFKGVAEMLRPQYKPLQTASGSLHVTNVADPIPQATMPFNASHTMNIRPRKFKTSEGTLDLCHFEFTDNNLARTTKFDVVIGDTTTPAVKGDLFSYSTHRADKHPIRENEQADVNKILDRYGEDMISILRKYQKKLE